MIFEIILLSVTSMATGACIMVPLTRDKESKKLKCNWSSIEGPGNYSCSMLQKVTCDSGCCVKHCRDVCKCGEV